MATVELYSKQACSFCVRAKMLLESKGVAYEEIRVDTDPSALHRMLERSDGRRTVPQIFINGKGIGGFDELWALEQSGELQQLLEKSDNDR